MNRSSEVLAETAHKLGVNTKREPADGVVITGTAAYTPLGNKGNTFQGMLDGQSGIVEVNARNFAAHVAAPVQEFNPSDHFGRKVLRGISFPTAMAATLARQASEMAGILDDQKMLREAFDNGVPLDKHRVGGSIGSGIGPAPYILRIDQQLYKGTEALRARLSEAKSEEERAQIEGEIGEIVKENSERVGPLWGLEMFPEEVNSVPAGMLGYQGWGSCEAAACATGLSNAVESARRVKEGISVIDLGGGIEAILTDPEKIHIAEVGIASFAAMRGPLSTGYPEKIGTPSESSRPFDKDRDGFVLGEGGAVIVFERNDLARLREAKILAEVVGYSKSLDGSDPRQTDLDVSNVARTILEACCNLHTGEFEIPDVIFAHATSTKDGDIAEAKALHLAFGDLLEEIPITANKSNIGHLAGGAGSVNLTMAIEALQRQEIPHILNLKNPRLDVKNLETQDDPVIEHVLFVRDNPLKGKFNTALVLGYGFGGNNAAMLIRKPQEA